MELKLEEIKFGQNKNQGMRNEITFNSSLAETYAYKENQLVELISSKGSIYCSVSFKEYKGDKKAYLSFYLKSFSDGGNFIIKEIPQGNVGRYYITKIQDLKMDKPVISKNIIDEISQNKKIKDIIVVNKLNGYSLKLPIDKVANDMENQNRVTLNIKHRKLLDVELPTFISQTYLNQMEGTLGEYYQSEYENVKYEDYYEANRKFINTIGNYNIDLLSIYPVFENEERKDFIKWMKEKFNGLIDKFLAYFLGQREIILRVIRPYPIDESENLVRLSKTAMELLGLEETDTILISNGEYTCKARVLLIDDWDIISMENRIKSQQDLSLLIGIPAYMRNQLNLHYINTNVFVKRDLRYFFRKDLNNQVITIISFMLSISFFNNIKNTFLKLIAMVGFLILMVYLSFSEIREKISNN